MATQHERTRVRVKHSTTAPPTLETVNSTLFYYQLIFDLLDMIQYDKIKHCHKSSYVDLLRAKCQFLVVSIAKEAGLNLKTGFLTSRPMHVYTRDYFLNEQPRKRPHDHDLHLSRKVNEVNSPLIVQSIIMSKKMENNPIASF